MAIFIITAATESPVLASAIARLYPNDHIQIGPGQWLVAAELTTRQLSDKLDVTSGNAGNSIFIAGISTYYGRHRTDIWEWIRLKWDGGPHG
jgi:hypothetical protein